MTRFLLLALALLPWGAAAHEIQHELSSATAMVVRLSYADGQPFAFEAYEISVPGHDRPVQVGRSDAQGRAVFLPPSEAEWRLRAFSADGHGVDLRLHSPPAAPSEAAPTASDRQAKLVLGAALLLAVFGVIQLVLRWRRQA